MASCVLRPCARVPLRPAYALRVAAPYPLILSLLLHGNLLQMGVRERQDWRLCLYVCLILPYLIPSFLSLLSPSPRLPLLLSALSSLSSFSFPSCSGLFPALPHSLPISSPSLPIPPTPPHPSPSLAYPFPLQAMDILQLIVGVCILPPLPLLMRTFIDMFPSHLVCTRVGWGGVGWGGVG